MLCSSFYSSFYVISDSSKVNKLNDNWSFVSFKEFRMPMFMISVENSLYMTGTKNVWKLDKDLNILIQYNGTSTVTYFGLYFNSTNSLLYVVEVHSREIHVLNLNLTLIHSFSTKAYQAKSINGYNNQMYIGTSIGEVIVLQNEVIVKEFDGCDGKRDVVTSMLFDEYGYFATSCWGKSNRLYLLFANGTYTGKNITTPILPHYIGFDSKGHFIQISSKQITLYK